MKKVCNGSYEITFSDDLNAMTEYKLSKEPKLPGKYPYKICIEIKNGKETMLKTFGVYALENECNDAFDSLVKKFESAETVDKSFLSND